MMTSRFGLGALVLVVGACGGGESRRPSYDAPMPDSRGGRTDATSIDGGTLDAPGPDAPVIDAAPPDAPEAPDAPPGTTQPPRVSGTSPASPANHNGPSVLGQAEPDAEVRLFAGASCTGSPIATTTAGPTGSWLVVVDVSDDSSTTFHADAQAAGELRSACSTTFATYVEDSTAPPPPVLEGTTPPSPSRSISPVVRGFSEPLATIRLYGAAGCGALGLVQGYADAGGSWALTIDASPGETLTLYATASDNAGNSSGCVGPLVYVNDVTPPSPPTLSAVSPTPPSNDLTPTISGSAEPGAAIHLYRGACTGSLIGSGTADAGGTFAIDATVPADAVSMIVALAIDAAGNPSTCSSGVAYVSDSTGPSPPLLTATEPASPSSVLFPELRGTSEPGAAITVFASASCGGTAVASGDAQGDGTFSIVVPAVAEGAHSFSVRATDGAGNPSGCSATLGFVTDTTAPGAPTLSSTPASPANDTTPTISGTAEAGATVALYVGSACTGTPLATRVATAGTFAFDVAVADDSTTTYRATATDSAFNTGPCATAFSYVEDSTAPAPPVVSSVAPTGPVDGNAPVVSGTAAAGTTVRLYAGAACEGSPLGSAPIGAGGTFAITATVADNTQTSIHATARDAAGNTSACSPTFATYVEQSAGAVPSVAGRVDWAGAPGRIFITIEQTCTDCSGAIGGTSIEGPGPFLIRGVEHTGDVRIVAWLDALGTRGYNVVADPAAQTTRTLTGASVSDVVLTLASPTPATPPAVSALVAFGAADSLTVSWEDVQDANRDEIADHYEVYVSTTPSPGPANYTSFLDVPAAAASFAILNPVPTGLVHVGVRARAGSFTGPLVTTSATVGPLAPAHTVTGTVTWGGLPDPAVLYVFAIQGDVPVGIRVVAPTDPHAYAIEGLVDGTYELGAVLDVDGDGVIDQTDPVSFESARRVSVTVAGGDATAPDVVLPDDPIVARVTTDHRDRAGEGDTYGIDWRVLGITEAPVAVTLLDGPDVVGPVDVGLDGDSRVRFDVWRYLGTAPLIGDRYDLEVTREDGTVVTLSALVTNVITDLATPIAPVGTSSGLQPTFSWTAPASAPSVFSYALYLYRAGMTGIWSTEPFSSATTSVAYDFDGRSNEDPLLAGTTYEWEIIVVDDERNTGRSISSFTTP